jgi:hypothetical protein
MLYEIMSATHLAAGSNNSTNNNLCKQLLTIFMVTAYLQGLLESHILQVYNVKCSAVSTQNTTNGHKINYMYSNDDYVYVYWDVNHVA